MTCTQCGQKNGRKARFCRFCGAPIVDTSIITRFKKKIRWQPSSSTRRIRWGRLALLMGGGLVLLVGSYVGYDTLQALSGLPSVSNLQTLLNEAQGSVVYDVYGKPVARLHGPVARVNVSYRQISPNMTKAIVAIEDHNFYHNPGFDLTSILRAAIVDLIHRAPVQGASTITEQLAKDMYLTDQKTIIRKIRELVLGIEIAHTYSKHQVLAMYLNEVYLGSGANGVAAAAKTYFNEKPNQLTLAQSSLIAGLPQAPSLYDPLINIKLAKLRQKQVLEAMVHYGDLTQPQAQRAYQSPLHLVKSSKSPTHTRPGYPYPWYLDQVIQTLLQKGYSMNKILNGGLKIYTALNPKVYNIAQKSVDHWMNVNFGKSSRAYPHHQAATVVENPKNGDVWAIIGGRTHPGFMPFDLATAAHRSSGSSIKPLLEYAPALARGYTEMSVIQDIPIFQNVNGQAWWPHNDNHLYRGYMTLRAALAISDNDVAVHLLHDIGIHYGIQFARHKFGLPLSHGVSKNGLRIAIGLGTNVMSMTNAYAAFANQGVRMAPVFVKTVKNMQGKVIYQHHPQKTRAISPQVSYIMTKMMEWVLKPHAIPGIGPQSLATGYNLGIGRPAAGKTGTNNGEADAWFIGYEPQVVCGVWEGNRLGEISQPYTKSGAGPAYGDTAAGPIWKTIMQQVNKQLKLPVHHFRRPSHIVRVPNISITSGKLASAITPKKDIQAAWFIQGTQPTTHGHTHVNVKVSALNPSQLWKPGCGPYIHSVFLKPEPDWHTGVPKPWDAKYWVPTQYCQSTPTAQKHSKHPKGPQGNPPAVNPPQKKHGPSKNPHHKGHG